MILNTITRLIDKLILLNTLVIVYKSLFKDVVLFNRLLLTINAKILKI